MRRSRSPHVSHVTRADDEGNGPPEFMCHMWMHERPPPYPHLPTRKFTFRAGRLAMFRRGKRRGDGGIHSVAPQE